MTIPTRQSQAEILYERKAKMIVKGRYVGLTEFDFEVVLDKAGNATLEEFKANAEALNDNILAELKPLLEENTGGVKSELKLTQQYLDVYEVQETQE